MFSISILSVIHLILFKIVLVGVELRMIIENVETGKLKGCL